MSLSSQNVSSHPTRVAALIDGSLPPADMDARELQEALPKILATCGAVIARLLSREYSQGADQAPERLLKAAQAAEALATTTDWIYRHAHALPFTVHLGKGQLRFSAKGIEKFIQSQQRRGRPSS